MPGLNGVLGLTGRTASTWKLVALSKLLPLHQHLCHSTKQQFHPSLTILSRIQC
uniref:Uncharacterized protein n=1 Tax=Arundo donax TaxID=35708 RepID=A0A0A9BJE6_ARUDO